MDNNAAERVMISKITKLHQTNNQIACTRLQTSIYAKHYFYQSQDQGVKHQYECLHVGQAILLVNTYFIA